MNEKFQPLLQEFILEGKDDYIGFWEIINGVRKCLQIDERKMTVSEASELWTGISDLITIMLKNGFAAVDLASHGSCIPWQKQDPEYVLGRIKDKWIVTKDKSIGFEFWFALKE